MSTVKDIYNFIDLFAPFSTQMDFDNSGLLVGSFEKKVQKIGVVLDITVQSVQWAAQNNVDLIISHHPVIFNPLKKLYEDDVVYGLVKNNIAAICAHTNLDCAVGGVNDCLADVLCAKVVDEIKDNEYPALPALARVIEFDTEILPHQLKDLLEQKLDTKCVRMCAGTKPIKRAVICGGAGAEFVFELERNDAQALITGEAKHHLFLYAEQKGLTLAEAGHFETENVVVKPLASRLAETFGDIETVVIPQKSYIC